MSSQSTKYPIIIRRCQHIKINGTQCGSPAIFQSRLCHFHNKAQQVYETVKANVVRRGGRPVLLTFPILEDASSIQFALIEVMQLLLSGDVDDKTAGLMIYALQTASANLRHLNLDCRPEQIVTRPEQVVAAAVGSDAWEKETLVTALQEDAADDARAMQTLRDKAAALRQQAEQAKQPAPSPASPHDASGNGIDLKASAENTGKRPVKPAPSGGTKHSLVI